MELQNIKLRNTKLHIVMCEIRNHELSIPNGKLQNMELQNRKLQIWKYETTISKLQNVELQIMKLPNIKLHITNCKM